MTVRELANGELAAADPNCLLPEIKTCSRFFTGDLRTSKTVLTSTDTEPITYLLLKVQVMCPSLSSLASSSYECRERKVVRQDVEVAEEGSPLCFAEMSMFPFKSFK